MHQTSKTPWILVPIWPLLIRRASFLKHAAFSYAPELSGAAFQERALSEWEDLIDGGPFLGGRDTLSQGDLTAYSAIYISKTIPLTGAPKFFSRPMILEWAKRVEAELPQPLHPLLYPHAVHRVAA